MRSGSKYCHSIAIPTDISSYEWSIGRIRHQIPSCNNPKQRCSRSVEISVAVIPCCIPWSPPLSVSLSLCRFEEYHRLPFKDFFFAWIGAVPFSDYFWDYCCVNGNAKDVMFVLLARKVKLFVGKDFLFTSNSGVTPQFQSKLVWYQLFFQY